MSLTEQSLTAKLPHSFVECSPELNLARLAFWRLLMHSATNQSYPLRLNSENDLEEFTDSPVVQAMLAKYWQVVCLILWSYSSPFQFVTDQEHHELKEKLWQINSTNYHLSIPVANRVIIIAEQTPNFKQD